MELKERKILEILDNHFGQFHKSNNDNSQLHITSYGLTNFCTISFLLQTTAVFFLVRNTSVLLTMTYSLAILFLAKY